MRKGKESGEGGEGREEKTEQGYNVKYNLFPLVHNPH
jgi:hypothetical protein